MQTALERLNAAVRLFGGALAPRKIPLCPELALMLLSDEIDLERSIPALLAAEDAPYWAFAWGSGQALARHLLDEPELVRGRRVVDLGAGSGIVAIAAKMAGADEAIAVDRDDDALAACRINAELNQVSLTISAELPERFDLLLMADILYENESARFAKGLIEAGTPIILADPHRAGHAPLKLRPAASYEVRTFPDVDHPLERAWIYEIGLR